MTDCAANVKGVSLINVESSDANTMLNAPSQFWVIAAT